MPSYLVDGLGPNAQSFPRIDHHRVTSRSTPTTAFSRTTTLPSAPSSSRKLLGNHFLRGGFEYRMYNTNAGVTTQSNGRYQNSGTYMTSSSAVSAPEDRLRCRAV